MNAISQISHSLDVNAISSPMQSAVGRKSTLLTLAIVVAAGATLASLAIALYTGWQSGGLLLERTFRMVFASVAVLFVHWLPVGWPAFRGVTRLAAAALWSLAITAVLYGQATFFMVSQQHAGDRRAATIPDIPVTMPTNLPASPSRTEIAKAAAKVSIDLARAHAQQCVGDCSTLEVRQARLAAQLTVLNAQADEAKRREVNEDRHNLQADHINALRERLRVDPVALAVATWLGATAHDLEMIVGLAHAVVLEGAAILGWIFVSIALGRDVGRNGIASGHGLEELDLDVAVEKNSSRPVLTEDDQLLERIHAAVVAGELKPTQESIRRFLRCGQPKAGKLNRHYLARFRAMNA